MQERDNYFDNARFILIVLIIAGHLIEPILNSFSVFKGAYAFLYLFHIPAFALISGHFAKNIGEPGKIKRVFMRTVPSYIVLQAAYVVLLFYLNGDDRFTLYLVRPIWILWYLPALFFWHLMLLALSRLNYLAALLVSLFISLGAGLFSVIGLDFTLSRTLVFFPYFLTGYFLEREHFKSLGNKHVRVLAATLAIAALVFALYYLRGFNSRFLYGIDSYSYFKISPLEGIATRAGTYATGALMVASLFSLVPRSKLFFTSNGARVIYAYVLHGAVLRITTYVFDVSEYMDTPLKGVLYFALSVVLAYVLTSKAIVWLAWPLVRPADIPARFKGSGPGDCRWLQRSVMLNYCRLLFRLSSVFPSSLPYLLRGTRLA